MSAFKRLDRHALMLALVILTGITIGLEAQRWAVISSAETEAAFLSERLGRTVAPGEIITASVFLMAVIAIPALLGWAVVIWLVLRRRGQPAARRRS